MRQAVIATAPASTRSVSGTHLALPAATGDGHLPSLLTRGLVCPRASEWGLPRAGAAFVPPTLPHARPKPSPEDGPSLPLEAVARFPTEGPCPGRSPGPVACPQISSSFPQGISVGQMHGQNPSFPTCQGICLCASHEPRKELGRGGGICGMTSA